MWPNPRLTADLVTFTGEIINRKLHFLRSDHYKKKINFGKLLIISSIQNKSDIYMQKTVVFWKMEENR